MAYFFCGCGDMEYPHVKNEAAGCLGNTVWGGAGAPPTNMCCGSSCVSLCCAELVEIMAALGKNSALVGRTWKLSKPKHAQGSSCELRPKQLTPKRDYHTSFHK